MRVPGRQLPATLEAERPSWMTAGAVRLGILCLMIIAIELLRPGTRIAPI